MNKTIKFPLAIKVNAWLTLGYPLAVFNVLIMAVFLDNHEYTQLVKNAIFDTKEPLLSSIFILETIVVFILVWMMYINKKYLQFILKVFYLDYFFTVLINISALKEQPLYTGIILLLQGLLILWLYLSKDVRDFMDSVS